MKSANKPLYLPITFALFSTYISETLMLNITCGFMGQQYNVFKKRLPHFFSSQNQVFGFKSQIMSNNVIKKQVNSENEILFLQNLYRQIRPLGLGNRSCMNVRGIGNFLQLFGENMLLNVGFSHSLSWAVSAGIQVSILYPAKKSIFRLFTTDIQYLGEICEWIHDIKRPNAYREKGITYYKEKLIFKKGKKQK
jgi:hypothetical protein